MARTDPFGSLDTGDHGDEERALLAEHIVAFRLAGPLFSAAAQRFLELTEVPGAGRSARLSARGGNRPTRSVVVPGRPV